MRRPHPLPAPTSRHDASPWWIPIIKTASRRPAASTPQLTNRSRSLSSGSSAKTYLHWTSIPASPSLVKAAARESIPVALLAVDGATACRGVGDRVGGRLDAERVRALVRATLHGRRARPAPAPPCATRTPGQPHRAALAVRCAIRGSIDTGRRWPARRPPRWRRGCPADGPGRAGTRGAAPCRPRRAPRRAQGSPDAAAA